jgi:hypothetical protein
MKTFKLFFLSVIISAISMVNYSCKKSDPVEPANHSSGSRSYSWSIDTVRTGVSSLLKVWGSSESDIWISGIAEGFSRVLFRYNGNMATPVNFPEPIEPSAIFGFSPDDIWLAGDKFVEGDSFCFWHYNGSWSRVAKFNIPGYEICIITDIWGNSPNNIYATGAAIHINSERVFQANIALLFHYDGKQWTRVNMPDINREFSRIRRDSNGSDKYYILSSATTAGNIYITRDTSEIFEFDGNNVKMLLSTYTNRENEFWISTIDKQLYVTQDSKIYRFRNQQLEHFLDNPYQNHRIEIWGRSENDMFLALNDGIAHYNGNNIEYIYKFNNDKTTLSDMICFQNSVFILAFDSSIDRNIIIKGTVKN